MWNFGHSFQDCRSPVNQRKHMIGKGCAQRLVKERVSAMVFAYRLIKTQDMKNKSFLVVCLLLVLTSTIQAMPSDKAALHERITRMTDAEKMARLETIKARVETIRDMDRSMLSRAERKELRKEVRSLNQEARAVGRGGVYISLGGILLIILILILIL